jgi:tRNA-dihydrouridine synthase
MVAASDFAFRCLCRQHGVDLTFTQMLHTKNLLGQEQFRKNHLDLWEYMEQPTKFSRTQVEFLEGSHHTHSENDATAMNEDAISGPVIVQLAGHEADKVVRAAQTILDHTGARVHGFDLNLGK